MARPGGARGGHRPADQRGRGAGGYTAADEDLLTMVLLQGVGRAPGQVALGRVLGSSLVRQFLLQKFAFVDTVGKAEQVEEMPKDALSRKTRSFLD